MNPTCELVMEWDPVLARIPGSLWDVYMTEAYHRLYESEDLTPAAFVMTTQRDTYVLPGLLRTSAGAYTGSPLFESAYGYGGPVCTSTDAAFLYGAGDALRECMDRAGIQGARLRLHPILKNERLLGVDWETRFSRRTVGVDLCPDEEGIVANLHPKHRNMISRAVRAGLEFVWDSTFAYLEDFSHLYDMTMRRLSAEAPYFYTPEYYTRLVDGLGDNVRIGVVLDGDHVVSAALFLMHEQYGHYHLSASCDDAPVGAGQYLVLNSALALKSMGAKTLHLGGGTTLDESDSLLRFKSRFGTLRFDYRVATWQPAISRIEDQEQPRG